MHIAQTNRAETTRFTNIQQDLICVYIQKIIVYLGVLCRNNAYLFA